MHLLVFYFKLNSREILLKFFLFFWNEKNGLVYFVRGWGCGRRVHLTSILTCSRLIFTQIVLYLSPKLIYCGKSVFMDWICSFFGYNCGWVLSFFIFGWNFFMPTRTTEHSHHQLYYSGKLDFCFFFTLQTLTPAI